MPNVTIIRPNISPEQEEKALKRIADVLCKMAKEEYGFEVKYELHFKNRK